VGESDLHMAHLCLVLVCTIVRTTKASLVPKVGEIILPKAVALLESPVLQGYALRSLLSLFTELVHQDAPEHNFQSLTSQLLAIPSSKSVPKNALAAISQAVAACCINAPMAAQRDAMILTFADSVSEAQSEPTRTLSLLCLGEIGREHDLSSHDKLIDSILGTFASGSDEVRPHIPDCVRRCSWVFARPTLGLVAAQITAAASFALGNIAACNPSVYLPVVLRDVACSDHQYLILHALKDMLASGKVAGACRWDVMKGLGLSHPPHRARRPCRSMRMTCCST